ncbi:uncharacterized protein LOC110021301 isoform X2 [Phalaenopsis equestris]|uniref:uncharacterized protein LOC110021301 isoform X2 n=1 Tax=Phalaenopsis equestris TaxID=78828 RepID=UPI0009E2177B|nr:uncharacterized protein LOC110021301 isoform X2 [Phalaenopsis equestris]
MLRLSYSRIFFAEKFRELVGEEVSSKSGKFTFLNCFDMGSGTFSCIGKEGIKLYVYNLRSKHVENVRQQAIEVALTNALQEGLSASDAAKQAQKSGQKAAKLASRQAKRIVGPILSSAWDFFEAVYYGGTMMEGVLRGVGTLFGTYAGGYHGEEIFGKLGYLLGSHLGSWVGGRIGLMVYDVCNGVALILQFFTFEGTTSSDLSANEDDVKDSYINEQSTDFEDASAVDQNPESFREDSEYREISNENSEDSNGWGFLSGR